tara:strand:+ start:1138 stop:1740 length:603 start_codon:yes stop_codon:yes gene_type:complete
MSTTPPTPEPYYKQGLQYLANMGNFANVVKSKAEKVGQRKTFIVAYINKLAAGIEDIKRKVEDKIKDVDEIDGKFDQLIKSAIGDQKNKLKDVFNNLKEISDFEDIIKELDGLKSSVNNIGNVVGQPNIAIPPPEDPGAIQFEGDVPLMPEPSNTPTSGGKRRKSGKKGMKGGYTYGKLRKRTKKGKKGKKGKRRMTLKK